MKTTIAALGLAAVLAACSEPPPPPKPAAQAPQSAPAPIAAAPAPAPAPAPEPAQAAEEPKPDPNKVLAARVKDALEAPSSRLPGGAIDVTAADGKVSLWGAVASDDERRRAAQLAGKVEGVKSVDNQLKVVKGS